MNRNMLRRVELAWPVTDPVLRQRIVDECLVAYLHDSLDAWDLQPDGTLRAGRIQPPGRPAIGAQAALMARYAAAPRRTARSDHGPDLVAPRRGPGLGAGLATTWSAP